ncbi:hypothetical protein AAGL37_15230, partial [Klebsiella pneumoniae]
VGKAERLTWHKAWTMVSTGFSISYTWTLISDIAPENMAGLTGGIFNFCANMASIIAPLIIGVIISATGNFFYALIYVGLTALIGVIAYIFIIGDIKRIELK